MQLVNFVLSEITLGTLQFDTRAILFNELKVEMTKYCLREHHLEVKEETQTDFIGGVVKFIVPISVTGWRRERDNYGNEAILAPLAPSLAVISLPE